MCVPNDLAVQRECSADSSPAQSLAATLLAVSSFFVITFSIFTLSTLSLALGAALLFTLFWAGVALAFLVPALLGSLIAAGVVWAWLVGSFLVARWLYVRVPLVAGAVTGSVGGSGPDTRYSSSSTYTSDGKNGTTTGAAAPVYDAVNVKTSKLDPGRASVYTAN